MVISTKIHDAMRQSIVIAQKHRIARLQSIGDKIANHQEQIRALTVRQRQLQVAILEVVTDEGLYGELDTIAGMSGVCRVIVSRDCLQFIAEVRVSHQDQIYDFGDYLVTIGSNRDSSASRGGSIKPYYIKRIRSGLLPLGAGQYPDYNWGMDNTTGFCLGEQQEDVDQFVTNNQYLDAARMIVSCLHAVNNQAERDRIPETFHAGHPSTHHRRKAAINKKDFRAYKDYRQQQIQKIHDDEVASVASTIESYKRMLNDVCDERTKLMNETIADYNEYDLLGLWVTDARVSGDCHIFDVHPRIKYRSEMYEFGHFRVFLGGNSGVHNYTVSVKSMDLDRRFSYAFNNLHNKNIRDECGFINYCEMVDRVHRKDYLGALRLAVEDILRINSDYESYIPEMLELVEPEGPPSPKTNIEAEPNATNTGQDPSGITQSIGHAATSQVEETPEFSYGAEEEE